MEQEGVIKYSLSFLSERLDLDQADIQALNLYRSRLLEHGLIGQDPLRYEGYGFGNISLRTDTQSRTQENSQHNFLISGTQTGGLEALDQASICLVTQVFAESNTLVACGQIEPSSESMSHGVLYQYSANIKAVIHVHAPVIWQARHKLGLYCTDANIPYGTPEMAKAIIAAAQALLVIPKQTAQAKQTERPEHIERPGQSIIFAMDGHEDGIVAAGPSLTDCTQVILDTLSQAQALSSLD